MTDTWYSRFLQRYEKPLARRRKERLKGIRNKDQFLKEMKLWTNKLQHFHQEKYFPPHAIVNADATRLYEKQGSFYLIRVGARGYNNSSILTSDIHSFGSLISFVTANGKVFMSIYVFPAILNNNKQMIGQFVLPEYMRTLRRLWPRYFIFTKTSYVKKKTWNAIHGSFL